jgi:predicted RNA-binding protein YlxR (DUF448 family)/ribosomal protein L7Ae-like RNA K-turn-binding protein
MDIMDKSAAIRTCAGCRKSASRNTLLRFALATGSGRIVPDIRRKAPGRGLSVHPRKSCLQKAVKTGAFRRAFAGGVLASAGELVSSSAEHYRGRIDELLAIAGRNRELLSGARAVRESLKRGSALLVVVARDASVSVRRIAAAADRAGARSIVVGTKAGLGHLAGRRPVGTVAVLDPVIAERISSAAESAAALEEDA